MNEQSANVATKSPVCGLATWQAERAFAYIEAHLSERIRRQELAELLHMSEGWLSHRFKVSAGMSPLQYIARQRVKLACGLLQRTREPLCQIAAACGSCDQAHFTRLFRRVLGVSPGAWRRANAPWIPLQVRRRRSV